ncbi:hypothetical protein JKP88DRAFT_324994 [Tribonema minus]|uniref:GH26 domain-containing protein n=1 Tax=Tribonema minus TaxID=303371 RepID=A0A835YZR6_9STRA|nr:hypothetical protein JKP88DRAFT_324994 [Tribonema minus]
MAVTRGSRRRMREMTIADVCSQDPLVSIVLEFLMPHHGIQVLLVCRRWKGLCEAISDDMPSTWSTAMVGSIALLRWARAAGCPWSAAVFAAAACSGNLEVLEWARAAGCPWDELACALAASRGRLEVLKWLRAQGCPWDDCTTFMAARDGSFEALKWAHAQGCPWDEETCAMAAQGGYLEILQWVRAQGCPWGYRTSEAAVRNRRHEVLKWAHANGCPWDASTCQVAAWVGNLEGLKWARAHGCPWDADACAAHAERRGHAELLQWVRAQQGRIGIIDDASITPTSRESLIGAKFQVVVKYQKVKELPGKYKYLLKPHLDANRTVVLVPEFYDGSYANLQAIGDGAFDSYLNKFIDEWKADGNRAMWIRPMHEFNGDWYSWGTYRSGNDRAKFQRAFKHVAYVFKNRGAQAKMQLSYNCDNARGENRNFTEWFPGTDVVDMVLCSGYNRAGTDSYHMSWKSFTDVFTPGYNRMAALSGNKPLGVAETSSTTWQSNSKPQWIKDAFYAVVNKFTRIKDAFAAVVTKFTRVEQFDCIYINKGDTFNCGLDTSQHNWFLINKGSLNWGLNSDAERKAFGDSINKYSANITKTRALTSKSETAVTATTPLPPLAATPSTAAAKPPIEGAVVTTGGPPFGAKKAAMVGEVQAWYAAAAAGHVSITTSAAAEKGATAAAAAAPAATAAAAAHAAVPAAAVSGSQSADAAAAATADESDGNSVELEGAAAQQESGVLTVAQVVGGPAPQHL